MEFMKKHNQIKSAPASPKLAAMMPMVSDEIKIAYVDMGQGDCTIVKLPNDKVVVIDCGSSAHLDDKDFLNAQRLLRNWANGQAIDVILTHPDKDHYNKIRSLVQIDATQKLTQVNVGNIYFSRAKSDNSPLGYYKEDALRRNLSLLAFPRLVEVTVNDADASKNEQNIWTQAYSDYGDAINTKLNKDELVLYSGRTKKSRKDWSISIIAGNVKTTAAQASATASNVVSLITLIQLGNEKLLLMGDATEETLDFLYNNRAGKIQNVSIFQIPHHGSESTPPSANFLNLVNPQSLRVSVGLQCNGFKLPKYSILNSWLQCARIQSYKTLVTYDWWKTNADVPGYNTLQDLKDIVDVKWKGYSVSNNTSRTFFWLDNPDDAGPKKSNTEFYGFTNDGYFLFRQTTKKDIWETGINGTNVYDGFTEVFI